jgi:hypothetical protein
MRLRSAVNSLADPLQLIAHGDTRRRVGASMRVGIATNHPPTFADRRNVSPQPQSAVAVAMSRSEWAMATLAVTKSQHVGVQ